MYTSLGVRNYRGFTDLQVDLSPITLISGRNNTGKTALLEAAFLHSCGPQAGYMALNIIGPFRTGQPVVQFGPSPGRPPWEALFNDFETSLTIGLEAVIDNIASQVSLVGTESSVTDLATTPNKTGAVSTQTHPNALRITVKRAQDAEAKEYLFTIHGNQQIVGPAGTVVQVNGVTTQLTPPSTDVLVPTYLVSNRTRALQTELAARYSDLKRAGRSESFLSALHVIEPRLHSIEVLVRDGAPVLHLDIGERSLAPLSTFGEGMSAVADIVSLLYLQQDGGVVLVDEIENGVHYTALPGLWEHVGRAVRETGTQIIATTHSRECVEAAHQALQPDPDLMSLLRLWRDPSEDGRTAVSRYDHATLDGALDMDLDIR